MWWTWMCACRYENKWFFIYLRWIRRLLAGTIRSWKSERKLVKIFLFSSLKSSHSKFWLFKPIFRHLDPEFRSGFWIWVHIQDPGPNWMRIQPDPDPKHWLCHSSLANMLLARPSLDNMHLAACTSLAKIYGTWPAHLWQTPTLEETTGQNTPATCTWTS
jgi:hypothetical protein